MNRRPQMLYGFVARSNWGEGDVEAEYAVGDVVYVPPDCPAVQNDRCEPGLHRVESCFSISEEAAFYYRLCPCRIVDEKGALRVWADWEAVSDRLHVFPDSSIDFTAGWVRLFSHAGVTGT